MVLGDKEETVATPEIGRCLGNLWAVSQASSNILPRDSEDFKRVVCFLTAQSLTTKLQLQSRGCWMISCLSAKRWVKQKTCPM